MVYRSLCAGVVLVLTGCFSEPPGTVSTSGSSSGGDGSTAADASTAATTSDSDSAADSSSSSAAGSSTGAVDLECEVVPVNTGQVPADVAVIVAEGLSLPEEFLGSIPVETNLAIVAPSELATELESGFPKDCQGGCAGCPTPNRVLLPYDEQGLGPFATLLVGEFDCILRPAPPDDVISAPTKHLWLFVDSADLIVPPMVVEAVASRGLRVHVACPNCSSLDPKSSLGRLVETTGGTLADSTAANAVGLQLEAVVSRRRSCIWPDADPPEGLLTVNEVFWPDDPVSASRGDVVGLETCQEIFPGKDGGEDEVFPLFFVGDDAASVELCPVACTVAQLSPANQTDVYRCDAL